MHGCPLNREPVQPHRNTGPETDVFCSFKRNQKTRFGGYQFLKRAIKSNVLSALGPSITGHPDTHAPSLQAENSGVRLNEALGMMWFKPLLSLTGTVTRKGLAPSHTVQRSGQGL